MGIADMFNGMESAQKMGGGSYFGIGRFKLRCKLVKMNAGGYNGDTFIAEFEVLESTSPNDPVGSTRSYAVNITKAKNKNSAFGDIKALIIALGCGQDPKTVPDGSAVDKLATELTKCAVDPAYCAEWKKAHPNDDPNLVGLLVGLETWPKPFKSDPNKTFTKHAWSPVLE